MSLGNKKTLLLSRELIFELSRNESIRKKNPVKIVQFDQNVRFVSHIFFLLKTFFFLIDHLTFFPVKQPGFRNIK